MIYSGCDQTTALGAGEDEDMAVAGQAEQKKSELICKYILAA